MCQSTRAFFDRYYEAFGYVTRIEYQPELEETKSNRWLTALVIGPEQTGISSKDIIEKLAVENIEARPVWKSMHLQALIDETIHKKRETVCQINCSRMDCICLVDLIRV